MADQTTKKDILQVVKLSKKYDYSDKQVLKQILDLSEQRNMFQSKFGKKYLTRLRNMYEDMAYDDVCIICNKNKTTAGVMCSSCMTSLVSSLEKQNRQKEPIEETSEISTEENAEDETEENSDYVEPSYEEPIIEEPSYEEPIIEEPSYEEPIIEEPAHEEPVYEEPVYEEPIDNYENVVGLPKSSKIRFCRNCGKMITSAMDRCLHCGTSRNDGYNYCGCCGNPVPMRPVSEAYKVEQKNETAGDASEVKKEKKPLFSFLKIDNKKIEDEESASEEYSMDESDFSESSEYYEDSSVEFEDTIEGETVEETEKETELRIQNEKKSKELFGDVKKKRRFSLENIRMASIVFFNNLTDSFKSLFSRSDRSSDEYPDNIIKLDVPTQSDGKKRYIIVAIVLVAVIIAGVKIFTTVGGYEKALGKTTAQAEKAYGTPKEIMNINAYKTYEYPEGIKITFEEGIAQKIYLNKSTKPIFGISVGQVIDEETLMKKMKTQGLDYRGNTKALDGHINYSFANGHYNVRIFTLGGMIDEVEVNTH